MKKKYCKPIREFIFTYGQLAISDCFIRFDPRQKWNYADIGNDLVEIWRVNISIRINKEMFENRFRIVD